MFNRFKKKKSKGHEVKQKDVSIDYMLTNSLQRNIELMKEIFNSDDTFITRQFENMQNKNIKGCIFFIEGMVNNEIINENIIKPIVISTSINVKNNVIDSILQHVIFSNSVERTSEINKVVESIARGDTALFLEGSGEVLIISAKGWQTRAISEPEGEKVIRGPREGFTESLLINLTLLRRKLITPDLKLNYKVIGVKSRTRVCICYINGIANDKILKELNKRLDNIDIDGIMDSGTISELIKDSPLSPFKTVGSTERPDILAAKLLEGRIGVIVDGTPVAMTVPFVFIEYFQANEDYYINFYFSSISRLLRVFCFMLTISLPAVFVALITFHQEMVPTPLAISLSAARQIVPFPAVVGAFLLLIVFEILRETGTRMPTNLGQALGIVGAVILGQAAVEAKFTSAPMVIIVALTGISGLALPRLKGAVIVIRLIFLLFASFIGLYGFMFGVIGLLNHLFELRSFGVPYMLSLMNLDPQDLQDTSVRVPWMYMKYRPKFIALNNRIRNASEGGKK
ncbi:MAG: spore germination protein [Bacillota bacterium]|nr:spore germination protein [Bacillota bacterium]